MGPLLGKPKNKPPPPASRAVDITSKDRAMLDLKVARDKLKKYQKRLGKEGEQLMSQAKTLVGAGKKDRALALLKLKRLKEKQVTDIDGQLVSVLEMIETVEWETHNLEIMRALKGGTAALNAIHSEMSVDDVERLMEESQEAIEIQNEIDKIIAGQFNAQDDELLKSELEDLMNSAAIASGVIEPPHIETVESLPMAPTHEVNIFPAVPTDIVSADTAEETLRREAAYA